MSVSEQELKEGRINDQLETQLEALSAQAEATIERGRNAWAEWKVNGGDWARDAADEADRYARENPWAVIGAAALIGVALGMLMACSRR